MNATRLQLAINSCVVCISVNCKKKVKNICANVFVARLSD